MFIKKHVFSSQVHVTPPLEGETETGRSEQPELLPPGVQEASLHQHLRHTESRSRSHHRILTPPTPPLHLSASSSPEPGGGVSSVGSSVLLQTFSDQPDSSPHFNHFLFFSSWNGSIPLLPTYQHDIHTETVRNNFPTFFFHFSHFDHTHL